MEAVLKILRGDATSGAFRDYTVPLDDGMVVLDAVHSVQAHQGSVAGPRVLGRLAGLEMYPLAVESRGAYLKEEAGIWFCNITKCCAEVCPESIHITDNAIIPLKERVVDEFYDPRRRLWRRLRGSA